MEEQREAKVSVIIPIFNVAPYLRQCLDSVIHQAMKDIEIIIVDDESSDGSEKICDEYAAMDGRIKVIHKKHEGLSCARNAGIEASSASYLMFFDGDDWVEHQFCEAAYRKAVDYDADIVLFGFKKIENDRVQFEKIKIQDGLLNESDALHFNVCYWDAAWIAMYRKKLFDDIRYPEGRLFEDTGTSHKLIHKADRVILLNEYLYNYRVCRPGSIVTSPRTKEHPDRREMYRARMNDLWNWGYKELAQCEAFRMVIRYGINGEEQEPFVAVAKSIGEKAPCCFTRNQKLMFIVFRHSLTCFELLCKMTRKRKKPLPR